MSDQRADASEQAHRTDGAARRRGSAAVGAVGAVSQSSWGEARRRLARARRAPRAEVSNQLDSCDGNHNDDHCDPRTQQPCETTTTTIMSAVIEDDDQLKSESNLLDFNKRPAATAHPSSRHGSTCATAITSRGKKRKSSADTNDTIANPMDSVKKYCYRHNSNDSNNTQHRQAPASNPTQSSSPSHNVTYIDHDYIDHANYHHEPNSACRRRQQRQPRQSTQSTPLPPSKPARNLSPIRAAISIFIMLALLSELSDLRAGLKFNHHHNYDISKACQLLSRRQLPSHLQDTGTRSGAGTTPAEMQIPWSSSSHQSTLDTGNLRGLFARLAEQVSSGVGGTLSAIIRHEDHWRHHHHKYRVGDYGCGSVGEKANQKRNQQNEPRRGLLSFSLPRIITASAALLAEETCYDNSDCSNNKICHEAKCICEKDHPVEDQDRCLPMALVREPCSIDEQCMGNSHCLDGICDCGTDSIGLYNPSAKIIYCHPKRKYLR